MFGYPDRPYPSVENIFICRNEVKRRYSVQMVQKAMTQPHGRVRNKSKTVGRFESITHKSEDSLTMILPLRINRCTVGCLHNNKISSLHASINLEASYICSSISRLGLPSGIPRFLRALGSAPEPEGVILCHPRRTNISRLPVWLSTWNPPPRRSAKVDSMLIRGDRR